MREGGDSRYSHSSPKSMTNDEWHSSFGCHIAPNCFPMWAVSFVHGRSFLCMGLRFCAWATVFVCGQLSLCMGNHLCVWWSFPCLGSCFHVWQSFLCLGGRFHAWVVSLMHGWLLALVGSLLHMGSLFYGSAGTIVEGWVVLTVLKNNNK